MAMGKTPDLTRPIGGLHARKQQCIGEYSPSGTRFLLAFSDYWCSCSTSLFGCCNQMAQIPSISESEWKVMKVLWAKSPQPAFDIINALAQTEDWHPSTIKTLLSRLHKKG